MSETRKLAQPEATPETQPFWEAAREGKLRIKRCGACGEAHYPPRAVCPFCHSADTAWEESTGEGSIYSFSIMRRSPTGPYTIAYVQLDEGPRMLTNIVDADPDSLAIGGRVCLTFTETGGDAPPVPMFRPAPKAS